MVSDTEFELRMDAINARLDAFEMMIKGIAPVVTPVPATINMNTGEVSNTPAVSTRPEKGFLCGQCGLLLGAELPEYIVKVVAICPVCDAKIGATLRATE